LSRCMVRGEKFVRRFVGLVRFGGGRIFLDGGFGVSPGRGSRRRGIRFVLRLRRGMSCLLFIVNMLWGRRTWV